MTSILLGTTPDPEHAAATRDIEAVARVESGVLEITIQKRIQGITVRQISYRSVISSTANAILSNDSEQSLWRKTKRQKMKSSCMNGVALSLHQRTS